MAVQFKPKAGKTHFKIIFHCGWFYFWPSIDEMPVYIGHVKMSEDLANYCVNTCFGRHKTPGDAARALHYGSANK